MSQRNGYAALVRQRASGVTKRRKLDDYETPDDVTRRLTRIVRFKGPIREPACGSGLMMRELRTETGLRVIGSDIKKGQDFLKNGKNWHGDTVTNPPYRGGLAERFARHALKTTDGRVCMLVQSGFLWGDKRAAGLFAEHKPDHVIIVPERVYFLVNGKPIDSQFFTHCWVCWPDRKTRERGPDAYRCETHWVENDNFR